MIHPPKKDGWLLQSEPKAANDNVARKGDWMQTFTGNGKGGQFWPLDPKPGDVLIRSIAHGLSMTCRYGGQCIRFLSVAEHSVHIARWVRDNGGSHQEVKWGLLHDASESQGIADIIRPVKPFITGYKEIETAIMNAVCEWAGLPDTMPAIVSEADARILNDEAEQNMEKPPVPWALPDYRPLGVTLQFWSPAEAEAQFLDLFAEITGGR